MYKRIYQKKICFITVGGNRRMDLEYQKSKNAQIHAVPLAKTRFSAPQIDVRSTPLTVDRHELNNPKR